MCIDKRLAVSQTAALAPRMQIDRKRSVHLFQARKMKSLLLLLLVTFAKASSTFEGKLVSSNKHLKRAFLTFNADPSLFAARLCYLWYC